jgi:de-etiolated-1
VPSGQEFTTNGNDEQSVRIKSKIFDSFFKLKHVVNVATNGEQLNRECSLFTDDSRYVIVGSAAFIPDESPPVYFDIYRNNESVSPSSRSPLEDYSLHLIDIVSGRVCDKRIFKTDKIFLSHNQGIYLYQNTLAVLSVQHQTIHVFQISKDGLFIDAKSIGRFCFEDDEFLVSSVAMRERSGTGGRQSTTVRPFRENTINALKHRLMVYLYRRAELESRLKGNYVPIRRFFQNFDQFCSLRIWKMQLLDENHLLLKYASEEVITLRLSDLNSPPSVFVVYNMITSQVISVFENTSEELLELFESFCDLYRNSSLRNPSQLICSPSNNVHSRLIQQRFKQTIINARNGGHTEAVRRLLAQLPISAQSYTCR